MQVSFVLAEVYVYAISESEKISFRRGLQWSAKARGTLYFTIVAAIFTSACLTLLSKAVMELTVGAEGKKFLMC